MPDRELCQCHDAAAAFVIVAMARPAAGWDALLLKETAWPRMPAGRSGQNVFRWRRFRVVGTCESAGQLLLDVDQRVVTNTKNPFSEADQMGVAN